MAVVDKALSFNFFSTACGRMRGEQGPEYWPQGGGSICRVLMFILFDSNVWISQVGLQSEVGAAVRHFAKRHGAIVAIPEIVKLEVEEKLTKSLFNLRKTAENSYRQLLPYMSELQPIPLPSEEDLRKTVENIIPTFDIPTRHLPFNGDVARSSLMKVIRKIPPSAEKREEFCDGVIWAHCAL